MIDAQNDETPAGGEGFEEEDSSSLAIAIPQLIKSTAGLPAETFQTLGDSDLPPVEYWPSASVALSADGLWQPAEAGDGEAVECFLAQVYGPGETLFDAVAWQSADPARWWLRYGQATHLGEAAITLANLEGRPVELVGTPREYLARHGRAVCILSWSADLGAIVREARHGLVCADPHLAEQVKCTIERQHRDHVRIEVAA